MISTDDYLWFVDRTLDQMVVVLRELGDEQASVQPALPGANSPYGIISHCLGVMTSWAGHLVAGREVVRDREGEFRASGDTETLIAKIDAARVQFRADVALVELAAPLRDAVSPGDANLPFGLRQGAALFHIYEELAQHLGQLEITRDILISQA
jgi:hypothetical protein